MFYEVDESNNEILTSCYINKLLLRNIDHRLELYICIQIQINQLLIFIEKLSPLPGFEPRTSQVPS